MRDAYPEHGPASPPRYLVAILMFVVPMSQIPLDLYTPALPQMVVDLRASPTSMQHTVAAYLLGMSLAFVPVGVVADARGRKPVLLTCLGIVVATSVLCAVAGSVPVLLAARFVEGAAASACMVVPYAIAADCFRGRRLTSVSGLLGVAWGLAPVLAPAAGGVLVQFLDWRLVFASIAGLAALAALVVVLLLPETLARQKRSPIHPGAVIRVLADALRHRVFTSFVLVFGLMASAQLAFGVAGPFLYQQNLGFSPAAYGLMALIVGVANLCGELACGILAIRLSARRLAMGALTVFGIGTSILVGSGLLIGNDPWALTIGSCLALSGCGVLCPQMYGLAMGLFVRNLGLIGGLVSGIGYLVVSAAMAAVGAFHERTQTPLGLLFAACGATAFVLLAWATARYGQIRQPAH
ncbi:multidrug effflux MFS transporter [Mycobacterium kansasii]|nr:multidrug effflux MFS transporter [Mycobacterium kansasii]ETZ97876.1 drug resistance transporter, Bcr/CflA subfamily protein [Mycobacterium kansasii 824]AGZ50816.1 MFS transporter [Mycobacterium kansasii ATCC 12478]EUA10372.1 drug resistance transporter, Bcr/CflA subfamily protein [Mycobacterium kansasii 662]UCA21382.1 multidrug effflux MFS transporter [Mycobacterium kansasii]UGT81428.1 multidrug effflux MFS transporter [Mycobacterium kansasii]